ncbi:uncharacterized protein LOC122935579 [Bufo gargarizans]|uniref:uncharacterized protein LOC122935579 n=1 Tax=Bufo gargarizans TaxID=30331 RepID=UPI001CF1231F|nr:uncharacterized protein LOC122935579 [Bufo gargarizans]
MGPAILTALCLWSCVLTVTPISQEQVGRITNYIEQNIFQGLQDQYAYFVKFTDEECNKDLQTKDFDVILKDDKSTGIREKVVNKEIYNGIRMVAASYIKMKKYDIHSESRLLNPDPEYSPISKLLEGTSANDCVVFFSLNSPCVQTCTDPKGKYNIIDKLNKHNLPTSRAFAYTKVFEKDKNKPEDEVWKNWGVLDGKMTLLRCSGNNCIKCFNNGVKDEACYKD